jgi:2-polyprenyl-6-methoxyphenol hydroxylase-like FAD-dependent oxidoreductase
MAENDVLIIGAGPTGLVLALYLNKCGVRARIVDKNSGPGQASRAMVVHARTLEFYRQLGFADDVVRAGIKLEKIHLIERGKEAATFQFGDFGEGLSPYPFALSYPQDDHERLLGDRLTAAGIDIEWNTELVDFHEDGGCVSTGLSKNGVEERVEVAYLCGCDGAHSTVRQKLDVGFSGGTYEQVFFVADVKATGQVAGNPDMNMCLSTNAFCLLFPIRSTGMNRAIGVVPDELAGRENVTFDDLRPVIEKLVDVHIEQVNWFSTYRIHHRVAANFRRGRVFLAGDAGHVHSPAGGQGMNTGIGDAVNLSWKLASTLTGRSTPAVLDSYETERLGFAHFLIESTDRMFQLMVNRDTRGELFRTVVVPHLAPLLMGFHGVRKEAFRAISQTRIQYRDSAISQGCAGHVHGGDRLPWVEALDNYASLTSFDWQLHIYGDAQLPIKDAAVSLNLPVSEFDWTDDAGRAGLHQDAAYLIRPDGYVALALARQDAGELTGYVDRFKVGRGL